MSETETKEICVRCREHPASEELDGLPTCHHCAELIRNKAEETRVCPVDGHDLRKDVIQNLLIDRCPECGGIWLDHAELEALLRLAAERDDDGFIGGVLLGLAW